MVKIAQKSIISGVLMLLPFAALAQQGQGPGYGSHMMSQMGWNGWFFGPMMMIVFLAVAVVVVVVLVRWLGGQGHSGMMHGTTGNTPLNILKERFARGEIDKEEFEQRRKVLGE